MTPGQAFLLTIVLTGGGVVATAAWDHARSRVAVVAPAASSIAMLGSNVGVRDQVVIGDVKSLRQQGFRTIIDLRPDGEAPDQISSQLVAAEANAAGVSFAYIPTPHGAVPDAVVDELARTLAAANGPVVLYCRSGNRAARAWALAEAGRVGGADAATIAASVRRAGLKVDDLMPQIEARAAARKAS